MIVIIAYSCIVAAGKDAVNARTDWVGAFLNWPGDNRSLLTPRIELCYAIAFTNGFLVFDWFVLQFLFVKRSKVNDQMIIHHYMAVGGFTMSMFGGFSLAGQSVASLMCETSSVFLNYKDMFSTESRDSALAELNQITFFVTYNVFRMALFPFLIYHVAYDGYHGWNFRNGTQ